MSTKVFKEKSERCMTMTMTTMEERNITLKVECVICKKIHELKVTEESVKEYLSPNRRFVQDIFPYLSVEERELLISKVCPKCWNKMFSCDE